MFDDFLFNNFTVFGGGGNGKGPNLKAHFDKWGWLSFLSFVAEKGVIFHRSNGQTNLDNVKRAKGYDVLVWASEQKDYETIVADYYERKTSS